MTDREYKQVLDWLNEQRAKLGKKPRKTLPRQWQHRRCPIEIVLGLWPQSQFRHPEGKRPKDAIDGSVGILGIFIYDEVPALKLGAEPLHGLDETSPLMQGWMLTPPEFIDDFREEVDAQHDQTLAS